MPLTERVRELVSECARTVGPEMFKDRLEAIVLTGSLARDEATLIAKGSDWQLLGDADLLLVFRKSSQGLSSQELRKAEESIESRLLSAGCTVKVGLAAVTASYFRSLPAHSYSYELKHCGKVVWGDETVLDLIPCYSVTDLSKEDGWRTLCNRMIELLTSGDMRKVAAGSIGPKVTYAALKLYLDMATSFLIFSGAYEPTYENRKKRLQAISALSRLDAPFDLKEFCARVSQCTDWKLHGMPSHAMDARFVQEAMTHALDLWFWEAAKLAGASTPATVEKTIKLLARQQTASQRLRGWASLLRRRHWLKSWRHWPRWARLSFTATPRYLIYEVATELFSCLASLGETERGISGVNLRKLRSKLPSVSPEPLKGPSDRQTIVGDLSHNYKDYLCQTHA